MAAPPLATEAPRPDPAHRAKVALGVLTTALMAAIAWATWAGLGDAGAQAGPIALGLVLALAAGFGGWGLARWARRPDAPPSLTPTSNEATLRAVLVGTTEPMVLVDPQARVRLLNPAAEILFGCLSEDIAGNRLQALFPELCDAQGSAAVQAQLAAGGPSLAPAVRETQGRRSLGQRFPVRLWVRGLPLDGAQYLLITVHDLAEQEQQCDELAYLRSHDLLTGLLNRQEFHSRLGDIAAAAAPGAVAPGPQRVLCHLDMDQFTVINHICGTAAGDKLLVQVARLIEAKLAPAELVARLGGDQFAVLLPGMDLDAAIDLCDGLMQTVRGFLFSWHDCAYDIAVSIGISPWDPASAPPDLALGRADAACRLAKRGGRNRIRVYREGEAEATRLHADMRLVSTINQALNRGGFSLFAQPIARLGKHPGEPPGERHFEVLVRMIDGSGELVVPSRFIPAAEHYILMPTVDRWIVQRLFSLQAENLRAWHQANPGQFLFAVNLSGTTVTDAGFLRYLKRQFADWQVPYPSICFEITETAAVGSLELARAFIEELSALGCRFALDDFGTGLSSYAYLRNLGVHYLKIDGSFVRGAVDDPINRAMVESINHMGHILGLQTIAEWAENPATLTLLRDLGVDYAQGYALGAAIPVAEFTLAHASAPSPPERRGHDRPPRAD